MTVSKNMGTLLKVPIIRIVICWGLYWGSPLEGNHQTWNQEEWPQTEMCNFKLIQDHVVLATVLAVLALKISIKNVPLL